MLTKFLPLCSPKNSLQPLQSLPEISISSDTNVDIVSIPPHTTSPPAPVHPGKDPPPLPTNSSPKVYTHRKSNPINTYLRAYARIKHPSVLKEDFIGNIATNNAIRDPKWHQAMDEDLSNLRQNRT
jgi:hypothetical protein